LGGEPGEVEYDKEEREVLSFLGASKRVDVRWLDRARREQLRRVLDGLHNGKRVSLLRISKDTGKSYTAIWGLCRALGIQTRSVAEAQANSAASRSKHKRTPFGGSEEERAYMLGFKNGDLTAWQVSGTAVMVTSTTTHPAFSEVFRSLFGRYGHVYEYPMDEEGRGYKWKVGVRLDNSFRFLIQSQEASLEGVSKSRREFLAWFAGIVDSDGHVRVTNSSGYARAVIAVYSTNRTFLVKLRDLSAGLGVHFDGPHLTAKEGTTTPKGITYRKDFSNIAVQRSAEAQSLLGELPLRHAEKLERRRLALSLNPATRWEEVDGRVSEVKNRIRAEVAEYVTLAEAEYKKKRGGEAKD
jgi:hypothetical protein